MFGLLEFIGFTAWDQVLGVLTDWRLRRLGVI